MRSFPYKLLSLQWTCKSLTEGYSRLYIAINDTTGRRGREERGRERGRWTEREGGRRREREERGREREREREGEGEWEGEEGGEGEGEILHTCNK